MNRVTIDAKTKKQAIEKCQKEHGFTPAAVHQVDSGGKGKAWMCFESGYDADVWANQK